MGGSPSPLTARGLLFLVIHLGTSFAGGEDGYMRYRFVFTAVADMAVADGLALSEVELLAAATTAQDGGEVMLVNAAFNAGGHSPNGEGPHYAIDGDTVSKFLDMNFPLRNESFLELHLPTKGMLSGYRFTTANDAPKRDPVSWRLEGCSDIVQCEAGVWHVLHDVANASPPVERASPYANFWLVAPPPPSPPLPVYKLVITDVREPNRADGVSLSEVQLYGTSGQLLPVTLAVNVDGTTPRGQEAKYVADVNLMSEWLDLGWAANEQRSELVLTLGSYDDVAAYELFTSVTPQPKRDPTSWSLYFAQRHETQPWRYNWVPISVKIAQTPPYDRATSITGGPIVDLMWPPPLPPFPPTPPMSPPPPPSIPPPPSPSPAPPLPPLTPQPKPPPMPPRAPSPLPSPPAPPQPPPQDVDGVSESLTGGSSNGSANAGTVAGVTVAATISGMIGLCLIMCCIGRVCIQTGNCPARIRVLIADITLEATIEQKRRPDKRRSKRGARTAPPGEDDASALVSTRSSTQAGEEEGSEPSASLPRPRRERAPGIKRFIMRSTPRPSNTDTANMAEEALTPRQDEAFARQLGWLMRNEDAACSDRAASPWPVDDSQGAVHDPVDGGDAAPVNVSVEPEPAALLQLEAAPAEERPVSLVPIASESTEADYMDANENRVRMTANLIDHNALEVPSSPDVRI